MKILFVGDPHLKHTHLSEDVKLLKWIEQLVEETKPDVVVNLGDTFDTHAVIRSECVSIFKDHVDTVCNKRHHALKPFIGLYSNFKVIEKPEVIDGILYVPYLNEGESWPDIKTKMAITHNTFVGADFGFKKADRGIVASETPHDIVISGHVHKRHTISDSIGSRSAEIVYVGSPRATTAADAGISFGISTYDLARAEWEFFPSIFPNFRKETISVRDDLNSILSNNSDHYIINLVGTKAEIKALLASDEVTQLKKEYDISFRSSPTDVTKVDKVQIKAVTIDKMVEEYLSKIYTGNDADLIKSEFEKYYGH